MDERYYIIFKDPVSVLTHHALILLYNCAKEIIRGVLNFHFWYECEACNEGPKTGAQTGGLENG